MGHSLRSCFINELMLLITVVVVDLVVFQLFMKLQHFVLFVSCDQLEKYSTHPAFEDFLSQMKFRTA